MLNLLSVRRVSVMPPSKEDDFSGELFCELELESKGWTLFRMLFAATDDYFLLQLNIRYLHHSCIDMYIYSPHFFKDCWEIDSQLSMQRSLRG